MTVVSISKKKIINAIKTEPLLQPGTWFNVATEQQLFRQKIYADLNEGRMSLDEYNELYESSFALNPKKIKDKNCAVCAVGAVMRNVLDPETEFSETKDATNFVLTYVIDHHQDASSLGARDETFEEIIDSLLEKELHMNALSVYFETLWQEAEGRNKGRWLSRHQIYRIKQTLCDFVQDRFPASIEIDIDGKKPAKDVKVVS